VSDDAALEQRFLDAIAKAPDDEDARAVYADWLDERGDPRGEYLRLEAQLYRIPRRLAELAVGCPPAWLDAVVRRYDVLLESFGSQKIMAIKLVRELTRLGLREAKDLVERASAAAPELLLQGVTREVADRHARALWEIGSVARVVPHHQMAPLLSPDRSRDVVLVGITGPRLEVIRALRAANPLLGLRGAMVMVDDVLSGKRCVVRAGVTEQEAREAVAELEHCARVELEATISR
jgi:uncharacterized protein (TIGR02996 family)